VVELLALGVRSSQGITSGYAGELTKR